jgi:hypothetical protein
MPHEACAPLGILGPHSFKGDLESYAIHVDAVETGGVGCDLALRRRVASYRPATGYIEAGDKFFAWLVAVPEGAVTGTLTATAWPAKLRAAVITITTGAMLHRPIYSTIGGGGAAESAATRSSPPISMATPLSAGPEFHSSSLEMSIRRRLLGMAGIATLALGASLAAAPAANQTGTSIMTMKQDLADREKDIHWPEGFDPSRADLFSHNALLIDASCERIWGHIIDAAKWPQWYPNSKDVHIDGGDVLKGGTVFHWLTFGLPLESSRFRLASAGSKARSAWVVDGNEIILTTPSLDGRKSVTLQPSNKAAHERAERGEVPSILRTSTPPISNGHRFYRRAASGRCRRKRPRDYRGP